MKSGIYKLTSPNGKCYVGQSMHLKNRLNNYKNLKCKDQPKIYNAINKYGWDNFTVEILWGTDDDTNLNFILNQLETDFINLYDCINNGYNLKCGGDSNKLSEETKRKISESNKGKTISEEQKEKLSKLRIGILHSDETKEKMSKASKGKSKSEEHRKNISKGKSGKIPINQYDLQGNFIKEWDNLNEICNETGFKKPNLCRSLKSEFECKAAYNFIWKYKQLNNK